MAACADNDIPQWKKDLIARLRLQNKIGGGSRYGGSGSSSRQLNNNAVCLRQNTSAALGGRSTGHQPTNAVRCISLPSSSSTVVGEPQTRSYGARATTERSVSSDGRFGLNAAVQTTAAVVKMVQERPWLDHTHSSFESVSDSYENGKTSDSDSSEELHYGPGIVSKLKNKYLSLALRRDTSAGRRPSILNLRKATSLENMLDDDSPVKMLESTNTGFYVVSATQKSKNVPNRYRNTHSQFEMKRARSVETISSSAVECQQHDELDLKPHEDMLIAKEGNDKYCANGKFDKTLTESTNNKGINMNYVSRVNRPKRITPIMSEREKPPVDFVKQAKMIFEKRPELRTKPPVNTGDVAAKIANYKTFLGQNKNAKKPPLKTKPSNIPSDKPKLSNLSVNSSAKTSNKITELHKVSPKDKTEQTNVTTIINGRNTNNTTNGFAKENVVSSPISSPIPDVSRIDLASDSEYKHSSSLCETPDLIMTSSPLPIPNCNSTFSAFKCNVTEFIEEERNSFTEIATPEAPSKISLDVSDYKTAPEDSPAEPRVQPGKPQTHVIVSSTPNQVPLRSKPPTVPYDQPLKLIINGNQNNVHKSEASPKLVISPPLPARRLKITSPPIVKSIQNPFPNKISDRVLEKNLINTAKTLEQPKNSTSVSASCEDSKIEVPKKVRKPPRDAEPNSIVFKFTDRKDVPDYVRNDTSRSAVKPEKPKVGEGGIILLPGASIDESFTDDDDELMRFLEAPPSPCDVTFYNDNVLIDGKSSFSQKSKTKTRLKLSFVDSGPDIFEYPSESSLMLDDSPISPILLTQLSQSVPTLTGSTLSNYTPRTTEEFQPGITRSLSKETATSPENSKSPVIEEVETHVAFSAGTNSDILF